MPSLFIEEEEGDTTRSARKARSKIHVSFELTTRRRVESDVTKPASLRSIRESIVVTSISCVQRHIAHIVAACVRTTLVALCERSSLFLLVTLEFNVLARDRNCS